MRVLGIIVAVVASVANAVAVVLQASEARVSPRNQAGRFSLLLGLARRPRWLAGTALLVLAWPLQVLALAYAPITVVQPMLAAGVLVLLALARVRLGERVGCSEILGAGSIVAGVAIVIWAAPHHSTHIPAAARVAAPLVVVGVAALGAYALGRLRPGRQLALVIGAGLAYAWADFANKLLSSELSTHAWLPGALWLIAILVFGGIAFLEENTSLQRRPAITVAPVIGAVQAPLPVLMALWAGVESWGTHSPHLAELAFGLAIATAGAVMLGRSEAVARVSMGPPEAAH